MGTRLILPNSEYNRIYQVAHGVLQELRSVEKSCIFFATFGASILRQHYNIPARVVAGAFALCVGEGPDVVVFGEDSPEGVIASHAGFHVWVQTHTHIIDFMAPVFSEAFAAAGPKCGA